MKFKNMSIEILIGDNFYSYFEPDEVVIETFKVPFLVAYKGERRILKMEITDFKIEIKNNLLTVEGL